MCIYTNCQIAQLTESSTSNGLREILQGTFRAVRKLIDVSLRVQFLESPYSATKHISGKLKIEYIKLQANRFCNLPR